MEIKQGTIVYHYQLGTKGIIISIQVRRGGDNLLMISSGGQYYFTTLKKLISGQYEWVLTKPSIKSRKGATRQSLEEILMGALSSKDM